MSTVKLAAKALKRPTKAMFEEIVERLFTKQGGKSITPQLTKEMFAHQPRVTKDPSALITMKPPPVPKGEVPNLGMEQAMRLERGMAEEAYTKSPELFSPRRYGVKPVEDKPTRRLRWATDEDPADEILGGKLMYEEESSQVINPQGAAMNALMATERDKILADADWARYLWKSMTVKEMGKEQSDLIGRNIWNRFYDHSRYKGKKTKFAYFQSNFTSWRNYPGTYKTNHPEQAKLLEELWEVFKPDGS